MSPASICPFLFMSPSGTREIFDSILSSFFWGEMRFFAPSIKFGNEKAWVVLVRDRKRTIRMINETGSAILIWFFIREIIDQL